MNTQNIQFPMLLLIIHSLIVGTRSEISMYSDDRTCNQGYFLLIGSDNDGTNTTLFSTNSTEATVFVPDRYIPSSDVCGQRFERCSTATLTNRNRTISLIPLNDSVGLILHNRDNTDGDLLQHILSPENLEGCMFINFVPVIAAIQRNEAVGYCVKSEILHTFDIIVNFESLHLSRIQPRIIGDMYSLGTSAKITNFVYFDNHPGDSCFSTELPYNFFLVNNTLIEHSFGDGFMAIGTIGSSATCTNLQRIGECELATYCGREVFTVSIRDSDRDNFTPAPVPLTADGGFVFLCSSSYLVYITNSTLILYDRSTLSLLGEPFYAQFDAEDIMQGDCQGSETGSTAFVVTLQGTNSSVFLYRIILMQQDSSTTRVNVTDLTSTYLNNNNSEGMGSDMITAQTGTQYAIVSNGTDTFIYNWTLSCDERPLIIQSVLTFISFYTTDSTYQCRCPIPESPVMTTNSVTTTTPTTASSTTRTNPTTSSLTTTSSPSTSPGSENFQNLVIGSYILTILLFVIVLIIIGICAYKKRFRCSNTKARHNIIQNQLETNLHPSAHIKLATPPKEHLPSSPAPLLRAECETKKEIRRDL